MAGKSLYLPLLFGGILFAQVAPPPPLASESGSVTVQGQVSIDGSGSPLQTASVALRPSTNAAPTTVLTDSSGRFNFGQVPEGNYQLAVTRTGYTRIDAPGTDGICFIGVVQVVKGRPVPALKIVVSQLGVISGKVLDGDGEPIANAEIAAMVRTFRNGGSQLTMRGQDRTSDLGGYRISGLMPGRYVIQVNYRKFQGFGEVSGEKEVYPLTYFPGTAEESAASELAISSGTVLHDVDLHLSPVRASVLKGKVVAPASVLMMRPLVRLTSPDSTFSVSSFGVSPNAEDGTFELSGIPPGRYLLSGFAKVNGRVFYADMPVEINTPMLEGPVLKLEGGSQIQGEVVMEGDGPPLQNATVQLFARAPVQGTGSIPIRDNTFAVPELFRVKYDLSVAGLPGGSYVRTVVIGSQAAGPDTLDFSSGVPSDLKIVIARDASTLGGMVATSKGGQAAHAKVLLIPKARQSLGRSSYRWTETDEQGHFAFGHIRPGRYEMYAVNDFDIQRLMDPAAIKPFETKGTEVLVEPNATANNRLTLITPAR